MTETPLTRRAVVDEPGLVGAEWWQESLEAPVGRRQTLQLLIAAGVVLIPFGVAVKACVESPGHTERQSALSVQKAYGWSFGASQEPLRFDSTTTEAARTSAFATIASDLAPKSDANRPYYSNTLFNAPLAIATEQGAGGATGAPRLADELLPIYTPAMATAFSAGRQFAERLAKEDAATVAATVAVVVDLDGPESVAFAAGAAGTLDPVFIFENWPHPRGVVPAHLTLASAIHYQTAFKEMAKTRSEKAPPLFVLDRQRLAPYRDELDKFDNRYVARIPSASALKSLLHVTQLFYISPSRVSPPELDDLNEAFVDMHAKGISIMSLDIGSLAGGGAVAPSFNVRQPYVPVLRPTPFGETTGAGTTAAVGMVPLIITAESVGLGYVWGRSGTFSRSYGSSWGG